MQTLAAASPPLQFSGLWAPVAAVALPALLAYNLPPSSTMLNQCLAVGLWGAWMAAAQPARDTTAPLRLSIPVSLLLALAVALAVSGVWAGLPATILGPMVALVVFSIALAAFGASQARQSDGAGVFACFAVGLAASAVLSSGVAIIQAFVPAWTDGDLIARSGLPGRAVGNLRQPNHLCSLLLWGVIAVVALLQMRRLSLRWGAALVALMVFAVELSASRTGALGLGLLMLWGALDRRLSRGARVLLMLTPVIYAVSYGGMALYGHFTDQAFGAEARIASGEGAGGGGESPNSRRYIWANALALIAQQPWTGVGFGEFNIAWSLTAFPGRPTAFFDHTHNLPLQLIVELGLPLGLGLLGLLGWALFQAWKRSGQAAGDAGTAARAAFMLILMIGLHSLFEYPLWYAYFLLPAAFAWGFALGSGSARTDESKHAAPLRWLPHGTRLVGLLMLVGAVYAVTDYLRIASIYSPGSNAAPLNDRIAAGQRSLLFGHHADYAAATSPDPLPGRDLAFRRATHHLLDTRLLQSWAEYLAGQGQTDQARWLAQRLREFRNPSSDDFFAVCDAPASAADADLRPFQCKPPERPHAWREFVRR